MQIIKRDGRKVQFDKEKIINAIGNASLKVDGEYKDEIKQIANSIASYVESFNKDISVEEIQDIVENGLMESDRKDIAKEYIIYRNQRTKIRQNKTYLMKEISEKLNATNVKRQNANVDEKSFGGRVGEASDVVLKNYALTNCMSEKAVRNHINNIIYTHDLASYPVGSHNCLSIPIDDALANGFNTRQTDVRGAKSVSTACQLIAVLDQLQSLQQFGGVSATHLDWTLVPYVIKSFMKHYIVSYLKDTDEFESLNLIELLFDYYEDEVGVIRNRFDDWIDEHKKEFFEKTGLKEEDFRLANKDNLDKKHYQSALYDTIVETCQAIEGLYHNLNTLQSRSGNQLPFTSINYGTCTSPEGRLVIKTILDGCIKGVGKLHKTSIFPCGIFQCMRGVNIKHGDPNYDLFRLALVSTSRRLYPNYANVDWSGNAGYDINDPRTYFSTMGCRTANGWDINGFGQLKDGRGNICPVTIIMPTIAMMAIENIDKQIEQGDNLIDIDWQYVEEFMTLLDYYIHDAKDQLIERFEWICSQPADSAKFMYENGLMAGYDGKNIASALKHGTLAIGQLGLAETLQILVKCDHTTERGMELAKRIEELFKKRAAEFKEEYKLNFGVYYTPAENLCFTAMKKFQETYGKIPNVSENDFFTNSMHVPVWKKMSAFEKIDIESELTGYSSAGCITYIEMDEEIKNNIDALEKVVLYAMEKDIPYFAVNIPNDMCTECGHIGKIDHECPICGSTSIRRLRRVTGYLTGDYEEAFNLGKQDETKKRVPHTQVEICIGEDCYEICEDI